MSKKTLLISHDIGGFRPSYMYVKSKFNDVYFHCAGPAHKELIRWGEQSRNIADFKNINFRDWNIFVSTGWQTDFEKRIINQLCNESANSFSVCIDHWVNYKERLRFLGKNLQVNNFLVFDKYAKKICQENWPNSNIVVSENLYDTNFKNKFNELKLVPLHDLFLSDPISEHYGGDLGYDEFSQIDFIHQKRKHLYNNRRKLIIRPHPSENQKKYREFIASRNFSNVMISDSELIADMARSTHIFGASSYGMHLALKVGKSVYCSIPCKDQFTELPHDNIKYLRHE